MTMTPPPDLEQRPPPSTPTGSGPAIPPSDWWPAALGATRRCVWRRGSKQPKAAAALEKSRRFGLAYVPVRLIATPLYRTLWRVRVEGGANVCRSVVPPSWPRTTLSFFDSVVLIMTLRRTLSFVGKVEYLASWKTRRTLPALGMIPLDRSDGRRAMAALKIASEVVAAGRLFATLPRRHPITGRRPARRSHRRGLRLDGHRRADRADRDHRDRPHPATGHASAAPVPAGHRPVRALRSIHGTTSAVGGFVDGS